MATTVAARYDDETTLTQRMRHATKAIHDKSDRLVTFARQSYYLDCLYLFNVQCNHGRWCHHQAHREAGIQP